MTARVVAAAVLVALGLCARSVDAQVRSAAPPRLELAATGLVVGPMSLGSANATVTRPDGSDLVLFRAQSRMAPGGGIEIHLGYNVTPSFGIEVTGGWSLPTVETRLEDDSEGAAPVVAGDRWDRVTVEASFLWTFARRGNGMFFVRGGAGWARELAGRSTLAGDGAGGSVGMGVKYWWRRRPASGTGRLGLRLEGRAIARSPGLSFGTRETRFAPAAAAGIILGL